jgi:hypothetical protein
MKKQNFLLSTTVKTLLLTFLLGFISVQNTKAQGANAPEASGFEPVSATDMVNLSSGDMAYVLPLLEIDGFPVTLSYHAGIPMDMESSWVGLGWNINTGAIARGVVSTPDDWNSGKELKFTYYYYTTEQYTVNVGVGFGKAAEVGIGLSWGSNKSLSGSVFASVGAISASIDTDGNYSVGVSSSIFSKPGGGGSDGFGGGLSISGNVNKSGIAVGAGIGGSKNGMNVGLGISVSGSGVGGGFSIGAGNNNGNTGTSAGGGGSIGSFSAADMSVSSSGFYIPINIKIFSFGFGYQKQDISYGKGLNKYGYGSFYQNQSDLYNSNLGEIKEDAKDTEFFDYQRRNVYGDIYDQSLPQSEINFIADYKNSIEKINFTFVGYDSYNVNASGISGSLNPLIGENSVLIGEGFEGSDSEDSDKKMKVFYHNSLERTRRSGIVPTLSPRKSIKDNNLFFTFDGQVTNTVNVSGNIKNSTSKTSNFSISDFVNKGSTYLSRPKTGSFVEVFTNEQLDNNSSLMLLPSTLYRDGSTPLNREGLGYTKEGIGGYKMTTADGKTYHFSQPVYQYEKIEHSYINLADIKNDNDKSPLNSTSKRSATPYATHWLLTAITGPDYIDDGNNFPDKNDYGYWLRLDHGQWSNAFAWRTPYASTNLPDVSTNNSILVSRKYRSYSTFNEENIDVVDAGHFLQGRKDLYYLDKIVSKNSIAYFVKDIRKDNLGTDLDYYFNDTRTDDNSISNSSNPTIDNEIIRAVENNRYDTEYQLRLDKIIIQKRDVDSGVSSSTGSGIDGIQPKTEEANNRYYSTGIFWGELNSESRKHKLHQSNNVIDVEDFANYDYSKASKVIKFVHDYELAKGSPNTTHANKDTQGRLTLQQVKILGRGTVNRATENQLFDYMPPYKFTYKRPDEVKFARNDTPASYGVQKLFNNKDSWGFIEGNENGLSDDNSNRVTLADSWSLNQIQTPQGSTIDINYEEDDFYVEAFSRRYWDNNLKFQVKYADNSNSDIIIDVYDDNAFENLNFNHYFNTGDEVYLDLWAWLGDRFWYGGCVCSSSSTVSLDIKAKKFEIITVNNNKVSLKVKQADYIYKQWRGSSQPSYRSLINNNTCYLSKKNMPGNVCAPDNYNFVQKNRGEGFNLSKNDKNFTMSFKLLATKSPMGNSGGGLKVKNIIVKGDAGEKYETEYTYKNPNTGYSSGITSFYPVYGTTFVPYQNELPGPGVMYEWVTMKAKGYDAAGRLLPSEETRYHYYTLQPNFHIFDPNFTMTDNDGETLFKATVKDVSISKGSITGKEIKIEKNLAKVGQLISTEQFNAHGHLLNKTTNVYRPKQAAVQETFSSLKSVYSYNHDSESGVYSNRSLKKRLLSVSSKIKRGQILEKLTSVTLYGISSITYDNPDPYLGTYRTSINTMADGTKIKNTKYPAYEKYSAMGSKIDNINNKNMLTQEAMNVSQVQIGSAWKTTNANITTWSNDWQYRDEAGTEPNKSAEVPIWRKHKNFVWKDNVDENGAYATTVTGNSSYFNWGTGVPTSTKWQNVSEITRYNHYSSPLETKDINGNYASSKMADNWSKTIAGGNARYTEMYASGAEFPVMSGNNITSTEDEFTFIDCEISDYAHTGKNSVTVKNSSKAFRITGDIGTRDSDKFRAGRYKVSFWSHLNLLQKGGESVNPQLIYNGSVQTPASTVISGNWKLNNYIINATSSVDIYVSGSSSSNPSFVDDFRMHPIASNMNTYVYDGNTDELTYILDANNLATEFRYDKAGRLCRTYKEVVDSNGGIGGFKLVKEYRYNYKDGPASANCNVGCCDPNDIEERVYYNVKKTKRFFKNDCESGFEDLMGLVYEVAAGTYSSLISQVDADNQALVDFDTNGQSFANINGTCTAEIDYYNVAQSGSATKQGCTQERKGSTEVYSVAANTYSSTISQVDADQKAIDDVNQNKQANANSKGTCVCPQYPAQCNNNQCLIKGTLITLPNGRQELIENLKVGDIIYSVAITNLDINQTKEQESEWSVANLITKPSSTKIVNIVETNYEEIYSLNNGLLEATSYHLHLVNRNNVWKIREFNTIKVGDKIIDKENNIIDVTSIELKQKSVTVYKLDVEGLDVYYANNILTHNK